MIFFFKKPKVVLDCFTYEESIIRTAPVDFATKHYPEWWKKLPNSYRIAPKNFRPGNMLQDHGTMKTCSGFLDYYKKSIAIPLWSELLIDVQNNDYMWQFADKKTDVEVHEEEQRYGFAPAGRFGHMKIISPWRLKTKDDIGWVWSHAIYNFQDPDNLFVLPGIVNYADTNVTNINIIVPLDKARRFTVEFGQPMVHITPMTEKEIEIRRHLISKDEFDNMYIYNTQRTFINSHVKLKGAKEKFSSCPFSDERK